jgi:hypothetical protein
MLARFAYQCASRTALNPFTIAEFVLALAEASELAMVIRPNGCLPMTLYSTHVIRRTFSGGTINKDGFPGIINELKSQRCRVPAFESFLVAANSWDQHVMEMIPALRAVIGDNAGYQFTPADPIVAVGMARPEFITSKRMVDITIDLDDLDPATGFRVIVETDPSSNFAVVETVDIEVFRQQVLVGLRKVAAAKKGL